MFKKNLLTIGLRNIIVDFSLCIVMSSVSEVSPFFFESLNQELTTAKSTFYFEPFTFPLNNVPFDELYRLSSSTFLESQFRIYAYLYAGEHGCILLSRFRSVISYT
jgi:hypothetical protein